MVRWAVLGGGAQALFGGALELRDHRVGGRSRIRLRHAVRCARDRRRVVVLRRELLLLAALPLPLSQAARRLLTSLDLSPSRRLAMAEALMLGPL